MSIVQPRNKGVQYCIFTVRLKVSGPIGPCTGPMQIQSRPATKGRMKAIGKAPLTAILPFKFSQLFLVYPLPP